MDGKKQMLATLLCAAAIVASLNVAAYAYSRGPDECGPRTAASAHSWAKGVSSDCRQRGQFFEW